MITIESSGSFAKTQSFLQRIISDDLFKSLENYGRAGVAALAAATPVESGQTAASWNYTVARSRGTYTITWSNGHVVNGVPIAILLQYGHGTGTGGYVRGRDYINPAIKPVFDKIAEDVWKAVTTA